MISCHRPSRYMTCHDLLVILWATTARSRSLFRSPFFAHPQCFDIDECHDDGIHHMSHFRRYFQHGLAFLPYNSKSRPMRASELSLRPIISRELKFVLSSEVRTRSRQQDEVKATDHDYFKFKIPTVGTTVWTYENALPSTRELHYDTPQKKIKMRLRLTVQ